MLLFSNILSFESLRTIAFILHFFVTTILFWTPIDSIAVSLQLQHTNHDYELTRQRFIGVIILGIILLSIRGVIMNFEIHIVSLKTVINLCVDCIGTYFIIWTIIDGLDWKTYIYVVVFCG